MEWVLLGGPHVFPFVIHHDSYGQLLILIVWNFKSLIIRIVIGWNFKSLLFRILIGWNFRILIGLNFKSPLLRILIGWNYKSLLIRIVIGWNFKSPLLRNHIQVLKMLHCKSLLKTRHVCKFLHRTLWVNAELQIIFNSKG